MPCRGLPQVEQKFSPSSNSEPQNEHRLESIGFPQWGHNANPGSIAWWQWGHVLLSMGQPHSSQKCIPGETVAPQLGQDRASAWL
ncbi:MAG: hypothetical protein SPL96_09845 [Bacteroidales bacterium]|nr:hypothetical protein [Bacteroidales bacterium]